MAVKPFKFNELKILLVCNVRVLVCNVRVLVCNVRAYPQMLPFPLAIALCPPPDLMTSDIACHFPVHYTPGSMRFSASFPR